MSLETRPMHRLAVLVLCLIPATLAAQQAAPVFEVASIKPNRSGSESFSSQTLPDRLIFTNYKLAWIVAGAYQVGRDNVLGGPDWITTERFDINAKFPESIVAAAPAEVATRWQPMLQSLLTDRFR